MNKKELQKIYQKIVLKTNGGIDDYVVALCQIGNAINELDDTQHQIEELKQTQNQKVIEEIEKLKKEINLRPVVVRNCGYGDFEEILLEDVYDVIDNQIKLLKGEKK